MRYLIYDDGGKTFVRKLSAFCPSNTYICVWAINKNVNDIENDKTQKIY